MCQIYQISIVNNFSIFSRYLNSVLYKSEQSVLLFVYNRYTSRNKYKLENIDGFVKVRITIFAHYNALKLQALKFCFCAFCAFLWPDQHCESKISISLKFFRKISFLISFCNLKSFRAYQEFALLA